MNLLAVLFGIGVAVFLLVVLEIGARVIPTKGETEDHYANDYYKTDKNGIPWASPGTYRCWQKDKATGRMVYDVEFTHDEYGRRVTPVKNPDGRDTFFALIGCSFGYGAGVKQDQTLTAAIGELTEKTMPYNYSFLGWGPYDFLAVLEHLSASQIKEKNGIMIYLYIDGHIERMLGSMSALRWKKGGVYYERTPDGKFVRNGTFETGRWFITKFYRLLGKSVLLERFDIDFPPPYTPDHFRLFAEVIAAMRDEFLKKYPQGKFYVAIYPQIKTGDKIKPALDKLGVAYLDYTNLLGPSAPKWDLDEDNHHPSALAYHTLAEALVRDLKLK